MCMEFTTTCYNCEVNKVDFRGSDSRGGVMYSTPAIPKDIHGNVGTLLAAAMAEYTVLCDDCINQ